MWRILPIFGILLCGCGSGIIEQPAGPDILTPEEALSPYPVDTVLVYIEEGAEFDEELIIEGCEKWSAEGLGCLIVDDPDIADVTFLVDPSTCQPDEEGIVTFAFADKVRREVIFYTHCIRYAARGAYDNRALEEAYFVVIVAHEIGHHLGIWNHVPLTCEGNNIQNVDGVPLCGVAIMNSGIDVRLRASGMTAFDALAFKRRDWYWSALNDSREAAQKSAHHHEDGGCTLRSDRL